MKRQIRNQQIGPREGGLNCPQGISCYYWRSPCCTFNAINLPLPPAPTPASTPSPTPPTPAPATLAIQFAKVREARQGEVHQGDFTADCVICVASSNINNFLYFFVADW